MGPAAWAAIGRALAVAAASSVFKGRGSLVALAAKQFEHAIAARDLDVANAVLRDLAYRNREAFEEFMRKYGKDLPPEARKELMEL